MNNQSVLNYHVVLMECGCKLLMRFLLCAYCDGNVSIECIIKGVIIGNTMENCSKFAYEFPFGYKVF